ncbi:hypothetical protein ABDB87_09250 [Uliginosibacterium paludis]
MSVVLQSTTWAPRKIASERAYIAADTKSFVTDVMRFCLIRLDIEGAAMPANMAATAKVTISSTRVKPEIFLIVKYFCCF